MLVRALLVLSLLGICPPTFAQGDKTAKLEAEVAKVSKFIAQHPNKDDAIAFRAERYKLLGKYDLSLTDFNKAIQLNKKKDIYFHERATIYNLKRQYSEAVSDMDQAIKLAPNNAGYYSYKGLLLHVSGKESEGITAISKALKLRPNEQDYCLRATMYIAQNHMKEAQADLLDALKFDPRSAEALKLQVEVLKKFKPAK